LVDVANVAKTKKKETFYVSLSGKKRPCVSCMGRIESSDIVDHYQQNPGRFFRERFIDQDKQASEGTIRVLLCKYCHKTKTPAGKLVTNHGSASDDSSWESDTSTPEMSSSESTTSSSDETTSAKSRRTTGSRRMTAS